MITNDNIIFETEISEMFLDKINQLVKNSNSIVITSHFSPDDDSISSVLSFYYYVTKTLDVGEDKVKICYTGDKNDKWKSFTNFEKINFVDDLANHLDGVDLLIMLDGNGLKRFSKLDKINEYHGKTILIDHHPTPGDQFDLQLVAKNFSSTAEILYTLLYNSGEVDKPLAELFLLGIIGDTGNFRFINSTNSDVLEKANNLIKFAELNLDEFCGRFQTISENSYKLLSELMKNGEIKEIGNWTKFMFSYVDMKFCVDNGYSDMEISEASSMFTQYLKIIKGVNWGMIITPRLHDSTHSVSFRSAPGSVITREIGEKMGIGGGHDRASGGKIITKNTQEAINILFDWMKTNEPRFG